MGQQVALQIVVPGEIGRAVRALVALGRWGLGIILAISWKTHLTCRSTRVVWRHGSWKSEGAISGVVRVGCNQLVLVMVGLVLGSLVCGLRVSRMSRGPCGCVTGRGGRSGRSLSVAIAGETDWARLHVVASNSSKLRNDDGRLGSLLAMSGLGLGRVRRVALSIALQVLEDGRGWVWTCLARIVISVTALIGHCSCACKRRRRHPWGQPARRLHKVCSKGGPTAVARGRAGGAGPVGRTEGAIQGGRDRSGRGSHDL